MAGMGLAEVARVLRAIGTDQVARVAPKFYLRLTGQTGRGTGEETPGDIAAYYRRCFADYLRVVNVAETEAFTWLRGKRLLEYGPGDMPGMALLFHAYGIDRVFCVDRFPLVNWSKKNRAVLENLRDGLVGESRLRAAAWLQEAASGTDGSSATRAVTYLVTPSGLSGLRDAVDLIVSRAALEHVDDLAATFADMHQALCVGGMAIHQVDLKSHGLHQRNPLDFLTWSPRLWSLMYGHKGVPNRWRVDRYRTLIEEFGFELVTLEATAFATQQDVSAMRPYLAAPFRDLSDEDLSWLGFWLVMRKRGH